MGTADSSRPRKLKVIGLLAAGHTAKRAAALAGVERSTISEWRRDPAFQVLLEAAIERQRNRIEARLARLADKALTTLGDGMDNGVMKERLDAAKTTLTAHVRAVGNRTKSKEAPPTGPLLVFPPGSSIAIVSRPEPASLPSLPTLPSIAAGEVRAPLPAIPAAPATDESKLPVSRLNGHEDIG